MAANELIDGRYRLIGVLAQGGSAVVWLGRDERLARTVAVKILAGGRPRPKRDSGGRHRLGRRPETGGEHGWFEARTLAQLAHPHIAAVFDLGTHKGSAYMVLELVDGVSLGRVLAEHEMPWSAAVAAAGQVASALAAAHSRGLVHRDVSPANIMLSVSGIKLVDFGISALSGEFEVDSDGLLRGTPSYVAPERFSAETVTTPSDVYSLGVVLHRMLTGRVPENPHPQALPAVDGLPDSVAQLCLSCLAREPRTRPTAAEAAYVLQDAAHPDALARFAGTVLGGALSATQILTRRTTGPTPAPRRSGRIAAVAAAGALIWVTAWTFTDWGHDEEPPALPIEAANPPSLAQPNCAAAYQSTNDGSRLTVTADARLPAGWRLTLRLPSGTVTTAGQPSLPPGRQTQIQLGARPAPTAASVGDRPCSLLLVPSSGTPNRSPAASAAPAQTEPSQPQDTPSSRPKPGRRKGQTAAKPADG